MFSTWPFQIVFHEKLTNTVFISFSFSGDFSFDVIWEGVSVFHVIVVDEWYDDERG